jgi:hypothetical protein
LAPACAGSLVSIASSVALSLFCDFLRFSIFGVCSSSLSWHFAFSLSESCLAAELVPVFVLSSPLSVLRSAEFRLLRTPAQC